MATLLYLVIPCYNEEQVLPVTAQRLRKKLLRRLSGRCLRCLRCTYGRLFPAGGSQNT